MNMKLVWRKLNIPVMLLVLVLMFLGLPVQTSARGLIDLSVPGDLSLVYRSEETEGSSNFVTISGAEVSIYKVADISANGEFSLVDTYRNISNFPVTDMNKIKTQETWKEISSSIGGYIYQNNVAPSYTRTTDENGLAHFQGIELGLYYVGNVTKRVDDCIYSFSSFLISVPGLDENDEWVNPVYDVIGFVKCSRTYLPHEINYELLKTWNDQGYESLRPSSITVLIYCDGTLFTEVTLEQSNNWRYTWTYEEGHEWTFAEIINGSLPYTNSIAVSGNTYRLTNTYNPPETPPDTPPETPETPGEPELPSLPEVLGAIRDLPEVLGARRLPQTGQLWWPVPVLLIVGAILIFTGIRKNSKNA